MSDPTISIIICTWNRCRLLAETLATLRSQRWNNDGAVEVLVVDNNSSDGTAAIIPALQADWPLGKLRYLHEPRQGKQFALNHAIRSASGNILAFTDDDVVLPENWLQTILRMSENTKWELIGGKTDLLWPGGTPPPWFHPSMLAVVAGVDLGDQRLSAPPADYAPAGTNLIARRSLFDRVGLFSESHFRHMDYEFGIRARQAGAIVEYDPELVVHTQVPEEVLNKRYFLRWHFKLGIAQAMHSKDRSKKLFMVPRWIWGQVLKDSIRFTFQAVRGQTNEAFVVQVRATRLLGYIAAIWHQRLHPDTHQQWVERWSQKRGAKFG